MIYITFIDPKTKKEKTTQIVRPLVIGRGKEADVEICGDLTISRLHTLIVPRKDGRVEIRDLASSAGTFITKQGQKLRLLAEKGDAEKGRAILFDEESFFVGRLEIKVHYKELAEEPTYQEDYTKEAEEVTEIEKEETL